MTRVVVHNHLSGRDAILAGRQPRSALRVPHRIHKQFTADCGSDCECDSCAASSRDRMPLRSTRDAIHKAGFGLYIGQDFFRPSADLQVEFIRDLGGGKVLVRLPDPLPLAPKWAGRQAVAVRQAIA